MYDVDSRFGLEMKKKVDDFCFCILDMKLALSHSTRSLEGRKRRTPMFSSPVRSHGNDTPLSGGMVVDFFHLTFKREKCWSF